MSIEAMKLALEALEVEYRMYEATDPETGAPYNMIQAITALRQAIEQAQKQEIVADSNALMLADWLQANYEADEIDESADELRKLHRENQLLWQEREEPHKQLEFYIRECNRLEAERDAALKTQQTQKQEPVACGGEQEAPYIGHDCDPYMTDSMKVFCPACCTKFRAIPPDVQKLLLDAGFEPPFDTPAPQRQPEQEPVAWMFQHEETGRMNYVSNDGMNTPELFLKMNRRYVFVCALYTFPPQRQPLTDEEIDELSRTMVKGNKSVNWLCRAIEVKLKEKNT